MKICVLALAILVVQSIYIPIALYEKKCMAVFTAFEVRRRIMKPLKLEAVFPKLPEAVEGQKFQILIESTENTNDVEQFYAKPGETFRMELKLKSDVIYNICFYIVSDRSEMPGDSSELRISYHVSDDLSRLIGTIQVPEELKKDKKLSDLYTYAQEISKMNTKIIEYQEKERKLEDEIAEANINKNFRIISLTMIECAVVILSGIYQIFTLRRFLIDKNLY